jgi:ribosomal protein L7Ae-like RNA K-turn-binding protein
MDFSLSASASVFEPCSLPSNNPFSTVSSSQCLTDSPPVPTTTTSSPSKKKLKSTLFDYISRKPQKISKASSSKPESKKDENRMIKAHIILDGEVVTAKIAKKDLYSGAYQVVQRKTTKLKKVIKDTRREEGIPPNQRPLQSGLNYREYVTQMLTKDLDLAIQELLEKLKFFYDRKKQEKSNKKIQKRFVKGFKECLKKSYDGSLKLLIMAPDIERVEGEGGLDDLVKELLASCSTHNIPVVFGLSMRSLGFTMINGAALVSVVGILDFSSCETLFKKVAELGERNRLDFNSYCFDASKYFTS